MGFLFPIILLGYLSMCGIIAWQISKTIKSKIARVITSSAIIILSLSFFLSRLLPSSTPLWLAECIYAISTTWLIVMLYGTIFILLLHIARLIMRISYKPVSSLKASTYAGILAAVCILIIGGHINARSPKVIPYHVGLPGNMKILAVSDLHMGYGVGEDDIEKLVNIINEQKADLCIVAGDLFDGDIRPVVEKDLGAAFRRANCPVVAVMGNHEYIGGDPDKDAEYIRGLGITLLRDSAMQLGDVTLVGRDDPHGSFFRRNNTKALSDLIPDSARNVIVIDHQPGRILESADASAMLHISGHTHAGQVWPFRFFTEKLFPLDYGKKQFGNTTAIVTSGYGTWGPRVRLASQSEILVIQ
ncbi:MAG: metallophosphoesterase [Bacteroidales bacterium]|nr:metallophosphoesterase [Bacteroidales bacterium]